MAELGAVEPFPPKLCQEHRKGLQRHPIAAREHARGGVALELGPAAGLIGHEAGRRIAYRPILLRPHGAPALRVLLESAAQGE